METLIPLPMTHQTFIRAADIYRELRKKGLTVRNSIDCMIASVAMEHDVALLHNDRDYATIATLGTLRVLEAEKPTMASRTLGPRSRRK